MAIEKLGQVPALQSWLATCRRCGTAKEFEGNGKDFVLSERGVVKLLLAKTMKSTGCLSASGTMAIGKLGQVPAL